MALSAFGEGHLKGREKGYEHSYYHTCAVRIDTTLWCWGWNRYGQLGLGGTTSQFLPRQVTA